MGKQQFDGRGVNFVDTNKASKATVVRLVWCSLL